MDEHEANCLLLGKAAFAALAARAALRHTTRLLEAGGGPEAAQAGLDVFAARRRLADALAAVPPVPGGVGGFDLALAAAQTELVRLLADFATPREKRTP